jgi:hypothetical protein
MPTRPPGALATAALQMSSLDDLLPDADDLLYEDELLRNPFSLKMWWRYIQARTDGAAKKRYLLYERALKSLPGSYKVRAQAARVAAMDMATGWPLDAADPAA